MICEQMATSWRAALAAACLAAAAGCSSPPQPPVRGPDPVTPPPAEVTRAEVAAAAIAEARAILAGEPPAPEALLGGVAGRPVYVCAWSTDGARCGGGNGKDLAAAVAMAAGRLHAAHAGELASRPGARLTIDFETARRRVALGGALAVEDLGLVGLVAGRGDQAVFLVPAELLTRGVVDSGDGHIRWPRLLDALAARNPDAANVGEGAEVALFGSVTWLERPGTEPLRLERLHPAGTPAIDADALLQRAVWAGDQLAAITGDDGAIRYHYDVDRAEVRDGINLIRHAGTIYALLMAYDRTHQQSWRDAAEHAIAYLFDHCERGRRTGPRGGGEVMFVLDEKGPGRRLKLGGTALALVALDQYWEATGDGRYLDDARRLARFLVAAEDADGHFRSHLPYRDGDPPPGGDSIYYPGESILGLVRLYAWDPDPAWLDAARRGADWLIDVRDRGKGPAELVNDHWLMIALSHLYLRTKDERYVDHSLRIARAVEREARANLARSRRYPDYRGSYYQPPRSTPAATRAEGLVAVLDTCALAGRDCGWVEALLRDTIGHVLLSQYAPDQLFWVPDPPAAAGGFAGGITDTSIRNDYVQHALSATLGTERLWRRADGVTVPGGPTWPADPARASWPGLPAESVDALRAPMTHAH